MPISVTVTNASGLHYRGKQAMMDAVKKAMKGEGIKAAAVDVILLSDASIHDMNKKFLKHDFATDVITFPLEDQPMTGEIYISVETASEQAAEYGVTLTNELCRLAIHGALHLVGHDDATKAQREQMHNLENRYLNGIA
ncbi:hypothetical protein BH10BAC6_BH10BAC6_12610 [soil metagenome]